MVLVDGGSFLMGSEDRLAYPADGEAPVRKVSVDSFWIDARAVSNGEFARFVEESGYVTEAERFEILVRTRLALRDYPGLERLFAEYPPEAISLGTDQLAPVIRELTAAGDHDAADELLATIGNRGADSPRLAAAAVVHYLVVGDWDNAALWLEAGRASSRTDALPLLDLPVEDRVGADDEDQEHQTDEHPLRQAGDRCERVGEVRRDVRRGHERIDLGVERQDRAAEPPGVVGVLLDVAP